MRLLWIGALFATAAAFAGVPETPELAGKVVDAETGRPIAGAIVVASVAGDGGSLFGHGHFRKLHCIAVRADADGRFRIPAWTWSGRRSMDLDRFGAYLIAYHPDYTFYTPGGTASVHQPVHTLPLFGPLKPPDATIPMHRFIKGDDREWRFKVGLPIDWFSCDWDADVQNEDLLWEAMREEVEAYDAANPGTPEKWRLEIATKRPPSSRPRVIGAPPQSIPARTPANPGSSAPAR